MINKKILYLIIISFILLNPDIFAQNLIQTPPTENRPVKIATTVAILNINEINAATQTLTANVFFIIKWKDSRLAHKESVNAIKPLKEIWNPNLAIINRQSITVTMPENAEIYPDGTVVYKQRIFGQFSQVLDYSDFPFDTQKFIIRLVSVGYSPDEVEFTVDSSQQSVISDELTMMDWKILGYTNKNTPYSIAQGTKPVASFVFEIAAERKSLYYIFNFILPLALIILMSMTVFWLDNKMVAPQISISVTSMLTLIAYRFMIAGSLPRISYLTRMDIFIFCSTLLIFMSLSEAIITTVYDAKGKDKLAEKIDSYSRWVFPIVYILVFIIAFMI